MKYWSAGHGVKVNSALFILLPNYAKIDDFDRLKMHDLGRNTNENRGIGLTLIWFLGPGYSDFTMDAIQNMKLGGILLNLPVNSAHAS